MRKNEHLLSIRLEGKAIGEGRIGVKQLLLLLEELNKALLRSGQVLRGELDSMRKGPKEKGIKEVIALDLVRLSHGSPATVLCFERARQQARLPEMDFGLEVLEKTISGLIGIQSSEDAFPTGYDAGVLLAWRDMGVLFEKGVDKIAFTLNHRELPFTTDYTRQIYERIQQRIKGPQVNIRTIEGRLLMADFKEHGTRCRIHPPVGDPILCLFDDTHRDEVLENILHFVQVVGEARQDPTTGKIGSIKIHDIRCLEDREDVRVDLIPQGSPLPADFWRSPNLDDLAETQGIRPVKNIQALFGTWPGDKDDGFEDEIHSMRQASIAGDTRP
jgi:hypothetical protein